jgi:hypothetical protein
MGLTHGGHTSVIRGDEAYDDLFAAAWGGWYSDSDICEQHMQIRIGLWQGKAWRPDMLAQFTGMTMTNQHKPLFNLSTSKRCASIGSLTVHKLCEEISLITYRDGRYAWPRCGLSALRSQMLRELDAS